MLENLHVQCAYIHVSRSSQSSMSFAINHLFVMSLAIFWDQEFEINRFPNCHQSKSSRSRVTRSLVITMLIKLEKSLTALIHLHFSDCSVIDVFARWDLHAQVFVPMTTILDIGMAPWPIWKNLRASLNVKCRSKSLMYILARPWNLWLCCMELLLFELRETRWSKNRNHTVIRRSRDGHFDLISSRDSEQDQTGRGHGG